MEGTMIKKISLLFVFLGTIYYPGSVNSQEVIMPQEVLLLEFVSYQDALVLAKDDDKKIFLLFTSENCPWCDKQKDVLTNPELVKKLKDYVVCFVDSKKEKELSKTYKVRSVPSYFILDKQEKILKKNIGYKSKEEFLNWIK